MSPAAQGPFWGSQSELRSVSLNPSHFRSGRWVILGEGVLVAVLGIWGLVAGAAHPDAVRDGAPVLMLNLTTVHSAILLGFGVVAALAMAQRRAAVIVTGVGTVGFLLLFAIGTVAAIRSAPGPLGFDLGDSVLNAMLMALNLALFMWLVANSLEGPRWVPRRKPSRAANREQT